MIFNYMNDFHSLKAARPSYAYLFIDHKFEYVPHIFIAVYLSSAVTGRI